MFQYVDLAAANQKMTKNPVAANTAERQRRQRQGSSLHCPVGEQHCEWLDEVAQLQRRVEELGELVSHDPLTGLFNFRHFNSVLPALLEGTQRSQRPTCLILLDLDHFKQVNDSWGHEAGNLVLRRAAAVMNQQVRKLDLVCRYGGEEFAIILPDTQLRQAAEVAERIRRCLEQSVTTFEGNEIQVTASLGVEVYSGREPLSARAFIDATDRLLYRAKDLGRNRIEHRPFGEVESTTGVTAEERDALFELFDK